MSAKVSRDARRELVETVAKVLRVARGIRSS
jgi:hypothetical protein